MAAVMLQVILGFYTSYWKKGLLISAKKYEPYSLSREYCISRLDDKILFPPKCSYHIILMRDNEELLQKLDAFCFNYQHVNCLYTLFEYRFSGKIVVKTGQFFDNVHSAVHFNHQNKGEDGMPSIAKQKLLRKKYKKLLLSSFQMTKLTQTIGSVFVDRTEQFKKTTLELELIKIVYCFLYGRGNYTSDSVSFKKM